MRGPCAQPGRDGAPPGFKVIILAWIRAVPESRRKPSGIIFVKSPRYMFYFYRHHYFLNDKVLTETVRKDSHLDS